MIKRLIFFSFALIFCLYYLKQEGFIHITDKGQERMDAEIERLSDHSKELIKKGMKKALETGVEMAGEVLEETKEQKIRQFNEELSPEQAKELESSIETSEVPLPKDTTSVHAEEWRPTGSLN